MARIITSKSRRQPKQMGNVKLHSGNAAEMGGFKHFRAGHEIARPVTLPDGTQVFQTPSGKQFTIKKMSS
jgi:hypothetical protein